MSFQHHFYCFCSYFGQELLSKQWSQFGVKSSKMFSSIGKKILIVGNFKLVPMEHETICGITMKDGPDSRSLFWRKGFNFAMGSWTLLHNLSLPCFHYCLAGNNILRQRDIYISVVLYSLSFSLNIFFWIVCIFLLRQHLIYHKNLSIASFLFSLNSGIY